MELIQETKNDKKNEGGVTLRDIVELVFDNWYWIVLSVVICMSVAWFYLAMQTPLYKRSAVMLVKSENKSGNDMSAVLELNGGISGSGVENEIYILQSHQLMREVVGRLHLDVTYQVKNWLHYDQLYAESPIRVNFFDAYTAPVSMEIKPLNGNRFLLNQLKIGKEKSDNEGQEFLFGDTIISAAGRFIVEDIPDKISAYYNVPVEVSRIDLNTAANIYHSFISTSLAGERTTLVQINCVDSNISRAEAILNALIDVYRETIIEDKNRIATSTAKFINERVEIISKELGDVENELTDFKQKNRIVSIDAAATQFMSESSKMRDELVQLETEYAIARAVERYLTDNEHSKQLIPNVSGVGDSGLQNQITTYNEILLQRERLAANSGENNPLVKDLDNNLAAVRVNLTASMDSYLSTLKLKLKKAREVESQTLDHIESVPQQEKKALGIIRQQSIKESLYTFLLNKREENALQLAITEANIRVIESPFGSSAPVAPARRMLLMGAFIVGLIIPLAIQLLRLLWNTGVRGRKDIEDYTSMPILGEIPLMKDRDGEQAIVVEENKTSSVAESFRLLRSNMDFVAPQARVVMFTSTMPGEGKSFVSRNFAVTLAMTNKKVVLLDMDLRKRTLSKTLDLTTKNGVSTWLSGKNNSVSELVQSSNIHAMFDIISAGIVPPNPSELLMSDRLPVLVEELKKQYDYIILDCVPALVVADSSIIGRVADLTIYVIRNGMLDRRYLPELEKLYRENKFKNLTVVINGVEMESKKYGYGYGYGVEHGRKKKRNVIYKIAHRIGRIFRG